MPCTQVNVAVTSREAESRPGTPSFFKVALIPPPPNEMLDFPCFSRKGTSPIFALGRVSPSFPTFEGHFGSGFLR